MASALEPPDSDSEDRSLFTDLVCPICLEVKRDCKIFQCENGHLTCEHCYESLESCSVCRVELKKPGSRCLFAEKAIQRIKRR